jgi:hypothetical protein
MRRKFFSWRQRPLASSPKDYLQEGQFLGVFVGPEKRRRENVF